MTASDLNDKLLRKFQVTLYDLVYHLWHFGLIPGSRSKPLIPKSTRRMIDRLSRRIYNEKFRRSTRMRYFRARLRKLTEKVPVIATLTRGYKEPLSLGDAKQVCKKLQRLAVRARRPLGNRQVSYSLMAVWAGFFQPLEDRTNFKMMKSVFEFLYKKTRMPLFSPKINSGYLKKLRCRLKIRMYYPTSWDNEDKTMIETWRRDFFEKGNIIPVFIFRKGQLFMEFRVLEDENQPAIIFNDGETISIGQSGRLALDKLE